MPLPPLIEIVPLPGPIEAVVTIPGSKSITNRALILAALAEGETTLEGALWSEDTQVMVECLQELGYMVNVEPDRHEESNRTLTVYGQGGRVPRGGTTDRPMELFVGNAGTAARFLTALVCLGEGVYRLHGVARMHERPQAALLAALRELGYRIDSEQDRLPVAVHGGGPRAGRCQVSIAESSQFASAILLSARAGNWQVTILGENAEESPYVAMTTELIEAFPRQGGRFTIEPDASSGSYFWAAGAISPRRSSSPEARERPVRVRDWPTSSWQIDARFPRYLGFLEQAQNTVDPGAAGDALSPPVPGGTSVKGGPVPTISRLHDLGDSIMTAITLAPLAGHSLRFSDLGRLRVQECERVAALRTELARCGARLIESGDQLEIFPSDLHGAEIETYQDHRMAMCFAILGLKVSGIRIKNPGCVKKTFPSFFQKMAAAPPDGLGASIRDPRTGKILEIGELFAD